MDLMFSSEMKELHDHMGGFCISSKKLSYIDLYDSNINDYFYDGDVINYYRLDKLKYKNNHIIGIPCFKIFLIMIL